MKPIPLLTGTVILLLLLNLIGFSRLRAVENQLAQLPAAPAADHDFELADPMAAMQRYADKLYFAGREQNWKLAAFYHHEIEEKAEEIAKENLTEDGVLLTPLLQSLLLPALEKVKTAIQAKDREQFEQHYRTLITNCNTCHESSKHEFVQITVPQQSMFQNQSFAPRSNGGNR